MTHETADAVSERPSRTTKFAGWRMMVIAFLAQNCAIGLSFGVYGTIVNALQTEFGTNRTLASSGLSLAMLSMGLLSPVVGALLTRFSIRALMITGALMNAAGYALLTQADSISLLLAIYLLILGPGICLLGVIPSSALVSAWFEKGRGRALGFVNMPFFVFVFPIISAAVLQAYGLDALFGLITGIFLCLPPILLGVIDFPSKVNQEALGAAETEAVKRKTAALNPGSTLEIIANPSFMVLALGIGVLTAGGVMMVTHLTPLALNKGLHIGSASAVLSAFGVAGAGGALAFGWIADRIGGPKALALLSFSWAAPWSALFFIGASFLELVVTALLMGICSGGIVGLCGVVANQWLGLGNFSRVMGLIYFAKIPFLFGAAPFAGFLYDQTGGYETSIALHIATFLAIGALFALYRPRPSVS
ncbi:MAG: MFS transporter [Caulobacterales bacterium]